MGQIKKQIKINKLKIKKRRNKKMKTLTKTSIIVIALIAIFSTQSFSQTKLGLEGGINLSNSSFTPDLQSSSRTGMMFGGFAEIKVAPILSIKPGVRYVMKGFTISNQITGTQTTYKINYIEIPALLKVSFPVQQVKPYIEAGPTLSLRISANSEVAGNQNLNQAPQDADVSQFFESTEFGLYFGGGLDFRVGNNVEMFTSFGYGLGLSNTLTAANGNITGKNNGFRITSGVKFDL